MRNMVYGPHSTYEDPRPSVKGGLLFGCAAESIVSSLSGSTEMRRRLKLNDPGTEAANRTLRAVARQHGELQHLLGSIPKCILPSSGSPFSSNRGQRLGLR